MQRGQGMWHALERRHMHSGIGMKTLKEETDEEENLEVEMTIILKRIQDGRIGSAIIWR